MCRVGGVSGLRRPGGRNIAPSNSVCLWPTCGRSGAPCGWNIAPINPGQSCVSHPFDHHASFLFRGPAPWTKRGKRAAAVLCSGWVEPVAGDCRRNIAPFRPVGRGRRADNPVRRADGTLPQSIQGRVAFPPLRPPRLVFFRGPAPWTKRGKTRNRRCSVPGGWNRSRATADGTSPHSDPLVVADVRTIRCAVRTEHCPNQSRAE